MWLMTEQGFFSAVQDRADPSRLWVRSRSAADIHNLLHAGKECGALVRDVEVILTPQADYPARVLLTKGEFAALAAQWVQDIDYDNFKNRIHDTPGQQGKNAAYMSVWSAMRRTEGPRTPE